MSRRWWARPGTSLGAVVLLLAAGAAAVETAVPATTRPAGGEPAAPARSVPVVRAAAVCPDPVTDADTSSRVTAVAPRRAAGEVALGGLGGSGGLGAGAGSPLQRQQPGSVLLHDAGEPSPPLVARGTGGGAAGLTATQLTRSTNATMRGLAGLTCPATDTDFWFVGGGSVVGQRGRVYLSNPEAAPAVVDITIYGPDGPVRPPDGRGITVAPGRQQVRLLDALAPGLTRLAVQVHARVGRVSAAVRDLQVQGLTPLGADWVPRSAPPARRLVVPGVLAGPGQRLLRVAVPGRSDAIVRLRLLTPTGPLVPPDLDVVEVAAGSVGEIDLTGVAAGEPVTVLLESDVPVTAGVLSRLAPAEGQPGEYAYAAATAPLTRQQPGVVGEARQGTGVGSTLVLAVPRGPARVTLRPLSPAEGEPVEVSLLSESQTTLDLATLTTAPSFAVWVVPARGAGPVYAAWQVDEAESRGLFVTSGPVAPGRYTVLLPRAVADLSTGLR